MNSADVGFITFLVLMSLIYIAVIYMGIKKFKAHVHDRFNPFFIIGIHAVTHEFGKYVVRSKDRYIATCDDEDTAIRLAIIYNLNARS